MKGKYLALCLNNEGYKASLEVGKVYPVIKDKAAEKEGYLRVIDESGDDYLFAADRFHMVVNLYTAIEKGTGRALE